MPRVPIANSSKVLLTLPTPCQVMERSDALFPVRFLLLSGASLKMTAATIIPLACYFRTRDESETGFQYDPIFSLITSYCF